ncbi:hypothetical protein [Pararhizobium sp. DWP3-4]|uniref:hypothetical protein n=1 Tax=Pararhizobium sp. DWP3-4 TaxID=2804565 RepID=UPI003CEA15FD
MPYGRPKWTHRKSDIDVKAQALSTARNRILQLQEQMTDKVLQMAAEVEKLMEAVPPAEAKHFLKARCNLPALELSTYVGFSRALKGSEEILRKARFVHCDEGARRSRRRLPARNSRAHADRRSDRHQGYRLNSRTLAAAKLTVQEMTLARNKKMVVTAARKQVTAAVALFEEKMRSFTDELRRHFSKRSQGSAPAQTGLLISRLNRRNSSGGAKMSWDDRRNYRIQERKGRSFSDYDAISGTPAKGLLWSSEDQGGINYDGAPHHVALGSVTTRPVLFERNMVSSVISPAPRKQEMMRCLSSGKVVSCRIGIELLGDTMTDVDKTDTIDRRTTTFVGGDTGEWSVTSHCTLRGSPIALVSRLAMISGNRPVISTDAAWVLRGVATNERYTTRSEKLELVEKQAPIGRAEATNAALILLRKNANWWALAQDERRSILEEQSHHIAIGLRYLPAVARRLLHCRDMGTEAPFDFLGFLDYAPTDEAAFEEMLGQLRSTIEWSFMDREIDLRLTRDHA